MPRPETAVVVDQLMTAQEQRLAWAELSHLQRLGQVCSYRAMQRSGRQIFHPYAFPISEMTAPYSKAA
jgi:hypothetical protein